ncbi:MAG: hypothetical protein M1829_005945 [Trizodia sp. TS-e1964]|nr:MAG: hypothetical protein M1829_005945 [Trizodia sp. TS-e1964]
MPARKRIKANPKPGSDSDHATNANMPQPSEAMNIENANSQAKSTSQAITSDEMSPNPVTAVEERPSRSWYGRTWPRAPKARLTAQDTSANAYVGSPESDIKEPNPFEVPSRPGSSRRKLKSKTSSLYLTSSTQNSPRSSPAIATTTILNISSKGSEEPADAFAISVQDKRLINDGLQQIEVPEGLVTPKETDTDILKQSKADPAKKPVEPTSKGSVPSDISSGTALPQGWLNWLSRPALFSVPEVNIPDIPVGSEYQADENVLASPQPSSTSKSSVDDALETHEAREPNSSIAQAQRLYYAQQVGSWLGSWFLNPSGQAELAPPEPRISGVDKMVIDESPHTISTSNPLAEAPKDVSNSKPIAHTSWAFWAKDKSKSIDSSNPMSGELAITGSSTRSNSQIIKLDDTSVAKSSKHGKRERPLSLDVSAQPESTSSKTALPENSPPHNQTAKASSAAKQQLQKSLPPNLLLPSFKSTYRLLENPSILHQIARMILHGKQPAARHVNLVRDPPRVKKALAIGVHGYFPAPLLRTVLGQPTGTSIRFANSAAAAISKWTNFRGYECEIEKIALEGEGKIDERVKTLWQLMLNWIDHIKKADFILVACHSQGVPVAMILVAKLIEFGCVSATRIGVCAMAGVNLGPFAEYKSKLFSGSAGELFEFSNPSSDVSKQYEDALRIAIQHGVRVLYAGSIDDQLVSLESSTFSTVSHPYIYRAVFIDGRVHAPDFIAHLVGFALKLRNLGISDHGLIRELSSPLAGSLYSGAGHSSLYDDEIIFDLSVEHTLESSSVGDLPLQIQKYEVPTNVNPFILPWSMRGVLEEEYVKTELDRETSDLLEQFDNWKPTSKVLKDVKFRLEAVRSKL